MTEDDFGSDVLRRAEDLLVGELARFAVDEALVEVGRQRHQPHLSSNIHSLISVVVIGECAILDSGTLTESTIVSNGWISKWISRWIK